MGANLTQKIIQEHLVSGSMEAGKSISVRIDQTLTQDATGTMAYLQFEAMGVPRVKTKLSVSYVDHNTLQQDYMNPDDHLFLQSIAAKHGIYFSRPGNGICHQIHMERFGVPGTTLLGSDSHTPTGGGVGQIAIGAGGLDVAFAMAGKPFGLKMPEVVNVRLTGKLPEWVSAKDVILELLRRVGVKGGVGKVFEYSGPGVATLAVPERATITNMGAETGATTSVFPSDEVTKAWLESQGRGDQYVALSADKDAVYSDTIEIDLSSLVPLLAVDPSPGDVKTVEELAGMKVDQVAVGSCTNSSFRDLAIFAEILNGKVVNPNVSVTVSPGSRAVYQQIEKSGHLSMLIAAGVRILEATCGPCIGQGGAPPSGGVTVRTFNRNFAGRTGTKSAKAYLVSPEVAGACALTAVMTDPRTLGKAPVIKITSPVIDDRMIIPPYTEEAAKQVKIIRGPNIAPLPEFRPLPDKISGEVLLYLGDNITTDHIQPAGKYLPLRSNVPEYARKATFVQVDPTFASRAEALRDSGGYGFIVGGENYGQGSSREHAGLCPMFLGVKAVITTSFARIHLANLINFGILPLTFANPEDYGKIKQGDKVTLNTSDISSELLTLVVNGGTEIKLKPAFSEKDIPMLKAGGALAMI
ncbi:MAG: aconitate hydratase [Nitrospirae bacterium]|nr:aconitate hydratase [Nitrospirota bacterium]